MTRTKKNRGARRTTAYEVAVRTTMSGGFNFYRFDDFNAAFTFYKAYKERVRQYGLKRYYITFEIYSYAEHYHEHKEYLTADYNNNFSLTMYDNEIENNRYFRTLEQAYR